MQRKEHKSLKREKSDLEKFSRELFGEKAVLQKQVAFLEKELSDTKIAKEAMDEKLEETVSKKVKLELELVEAKARLNLKKEQSKQSGEETESLRKKLEEKSQLCFERSVEIEKLKKSCEKLTVILEEKSLVLSNTKKQVEETRSKLNALERDKSELEAENKRLRDCKNTDDVLNGSYFTVEEKEEAKKNLFNDKKYFTLFNSLLHVMEGSYMVYLLNL